MKGLGRSAVAIGVIAGAALGVAGEASADSPILWQGNSLTYLYGQNFEVDPSTQQTVTFEHASSWTAGDLFIFVDKIFYNGEESATNGSNTYYGEFTPRLSFNKIFDQSFRLGPISDVLLAGTREFGEGDVETTLLGLGVDLAIPGFDYAQINVYHRDPDGDRDGDTWQITPVWSVTIPAGESDFLIDGYIDWVVDNDDSYHANLHVNPQIKYDLGKAMQWGEKKLYVGFEYDYWSNKYGIENSTAFDTDQNTASLLVKYNL